MLGSHNAFTFRNLVTLYTITGFVVLHNTSSNMEQSHSWETNNIITDISKSLIFSSENIPYLKWSLNFCPYHYYPVVWTTIQTTQWYCCGSTNCLLNIFSSTILPPPLTHCGQFICSECVNITCHLFLYTSSTLKARHDQSDTCIK